MWLPPDERWAGRFQATGGDGFSTGGFEIMMFQGVAQGFSTVSTDGGHPDNAQDASWALQDDRSINLPLFRNFASRSLFDMGAVGKAVTEIFYGKAVSSFVLERLFNRR